MSNCPSSIAATDPASLRNSLVRRVPDVAGNADDFLREAATEFFRRSGVWRDQRVTLPVNEEATRYQITPTVGRVVRVAHIWGSREGERECKIYQDTEIHFRDDEEHGEREQRWHEPAPGQIVFHRNFEAARTLRTEVVLTVGDDNMGNESLMQQYREGILAGASHYATMAQNRDTTNRSAAIDYLRLFEDAIMEASGVYQRKVSTERRSTSKMHVIFDQRGAPTPRRRGSNRNTSW